VDPHTELPPGLRPPAGGGVVEVGWRADLGSGIRVGDLAAHLQDLDTAVSVGERWGVELARASERWLLMREIVRGGPGALGRAAEKLRLSPQDLALLDDLWHGWPWGPGRGSFGFPGDLFATMSDLQVPSSVGQPIYLSHAEYGNPIDLTLRGAGLLLVGVLQAFRFARDWSAVRRRGKAQARMTEAAAGEAETRAELFRWLVDEAKSGRIVVPPGDLLKTVSPAEMRALGRLAATDVTLRLPPGTDHDADEQTASQ
jgi:hypothetical protein